jgi:pilus assembly protein CpaF
MFGPRSRKSEDAPASAGPLDRLDRRTPAEGRPSAAGPVDRNARIAAAAASLPDAATPRLREMMKAGAPAGEVSRQAGLLAQLHFRNSGVLLAPLELRGYVTEVLRSVLPASNFSAPVAPADETPAESAESAET